MGKDTERLFDAVRATVIGFRQDLLGSLDGLTGPQFGVLARLHHAAAAPSLADLARDHCVTPPAMSKVVDALVGAGLVERVPDADDRRVNRHRLTAAGTATIRTARAAILDRIQERIDTLSPADRAALQAAAPAFERLADTA